MWALTLPQVAATLAATLVAYNAVNKRGERLLDVELLNVVIVLMLTTAILGPVLTERFAEKTTLPCPGQQWPRRVVTKLHE
jgi:hypothetical protein